MASPTKSHWEAAVRVVKYLKGAPGKGILCASHGNMGVEAFSDADWAGSPSDRRSTTGYCAFFGGNLVLGRVRSRVLCLARVQSPTLFIEPAKAEECFHKLDKVKDKGIFNALEKVLTQVAGRNAQLIRDNLLTVIGDSSPHFEFLQLLFKKCSFNIFNSQHVHSMLERLSLDRFKDLEHSCVQLLLVRP
ncbi:secreted RxLR effector protein 161-like [Ipomoea triloba]|uniref:secreted RxLR effector protein 161-like n=1 Tax=Ipomoea triloba TaxID=35885 RepID=UPI00125E3DDA|nr:secreted RxLR effector protein 161-like [Ipomoea triloba]